MIPSDKKMTPKDYELFTKYDFEKRLKGQFKEAIPVKHLEKLISPDGIEHSVDLSYEFTLDGVKYLNIVECKLWNKNVTREMVKAFKSVRDDLRAHKAIMVTNHGYQSGAIEYAQKHGISLLKLTKRERQVYAHFDGGHSTIHDILKTESTEDLNIFDEMWLLGFFHPSDESLAKYLVETFGKEFAMLLSDVDSDNFDLDNPNTPISDDLIKTIESIERNWDSQYRLIESGGLNFQLENEQFLRYFSVKINLLKVFIQMKRTRKVD